MLSPMRIPSRRLPLRRTIVAVLVGVLLGSLAWMQWTARRTDESARGAGVAVMSPPTIPEPHSSLPTSTSPDAGDRQSPGIGLADFSFPPAAFHRHEVAFQRFAGWAVEYASLPEMARAAALTDGIRLARKRRDAMEDLIPSDPQRALELAVPYGVRRQLPPEITTFLEQPVRGRGDLEVLASVSEPGSLDAEGRKAPPVWRTATLGDGVYQAHVYGRRLLDPSLRGVPFHGVALANQLAVAESPVRVLEAAEVADRRLSATLDPVCGVSGLLSNDGGVVAELGDEPVFLCGTGHVGDLAAQVTGNIAGFRKAGFELQAAPAATGSKTLLVIRVDFPDLQGLPYTDTQATNVLSGLEAFYREMSYGKVGFSQLGSGSDVTPAFRMPKSTAYYGTNDASLLRTDARAAAKAAGFDPVRYSMDAVWFGRVSGFKWSGLGYVGAVGIWIHDTASVGVFAHELGHNFGLNHANFWDTSGLSVIGAGTAVEYGDKFDTMGSASAGAKHFNARYKSLLGWIPGTDAIQVSTNGVQRIIAHDDPAASGLRAIRVSKDSQTNYWVEYRMHYTGNKWLAKGIGIRWAGPGNQGTRLLDPTPGTVAGKDDAVVLIGRTFADPSAGIYLTPIGLAGSNPEAIQVMVNRGSFTGNRSPVIALTSSGLTNAANAEVTFTAAATDPDGDALAYFWDFGDGEFGGNQPTAAHRFAAGEYTVRCEVSDLKGGRASTHVVVRSGAPSTGRLAGRILRPDGTPVEGVRVAASASIMTWTDSLGRYTLTGVSSGSYTLKPVLEGYAFIPVGFANPVSGSAQASNLNFSALPPDGLNTVAVVAAGSMWSFLDDGSSQGAAWREPGFDDHGWKEGPAPLGYGDDNEKTAIGYGKDASNKFVTTYFRRRFVVSDPKLFTACTLSLRRDDGAVVYLNGREVYRSNMPSGTVTASTLASTTVGGTDETAFFDSPLDPALLAAGTNVLAVEIHQVSRSSSDIVFDLGLTATTAASFSPPLLSIELLQPGQVRVSWPDSPAAWVLQGLEDPNGFWSPLNATSSVTLGRRMLTLPAEGSQRFLRLATP